MSDDIKQNSSAATSAKPRMGMTGRQGVIFASGLLLGAAAVAVLLSLVGGRGAPGEKARVSAPSTQPEAVTVTPRGTASLPPAAVPVAASPPVASASQQHSSCPAQPLTTMAGSKDGQLRLQTTTTGKSAADVAPLILDGKEAAAAGRPRDAEVAFLMACMVADSHAPGSLAAADARYQLGRHYANLVLGGGAAGGKRSEMLRRAQVMYGDSAATYRVRHGKEHEKSRFAAEGLAAVDRALGQAPGAKSASAIAAFPVPQKQAPEPAANSAAPEPVRPAVRAAAPTPAQAARPSVPSNTKPVEPSKPSVVARSEPQVLPPIRSQSRQPDAEILAPPVRQATGEAMARPSPSFDCNRARSPSERAICSDPQLSQLDRNLGRLHARAKSAAPDAGAFRRNNDAEWRRRESICRGDRDCLLRWYAQRREQLLDDIEDFSAGREPGR